MHGRRLCVCVANMLARNGSGDWQQTQRRNQHDQKWFTLRIGTGWWFSAEYFAHSSLPDFMCVCVFVCLFFFSFCSFALCCCYFIPFQRYDLNVTTVDRNWIRLTIRKYCLCIYVLQPSNWQSILTHELNGKFFSHRESFDRFLNRNNAKPHTAALLLHLFIIFGRRVFIF